MNRHPLILTLDQHGVPHRWVSWQHACVYVARDLVAWDAGDNQFIFHGGINRLTGLRSELATSSIIAIRGKALSGQSMHQVPPLSNRELFHRDRHICAYCAKEFSGQRLTRDHILPVSQGGRDTWMNVVTACRHCNQAKSGRTPEQARMQLVLRALRAEQGRIPDPQQPQHPGGPDGLPGPPRALAKPHPPFLSGGARS